MLLLWNLRELVLNPTECDVICQNKSQVSSHIRQLHLGMCISWYVCGHRLLSKTEWRKHMKEKHAALPEESWFVGQGFDPSSLNLEIKSKVTDTDVEKAVTR